MVAAAAAAAALRLSEMTGGEGEVGGAASPAACEVQIAGRRERRPVMSDQPALHMPSVISSAAERLGTQRQFSL